MKPAIKEAIIVEGRYDKNMLSLCVDANIIEVGGFSVFKKPELISLLKRLAETCGIIVMTDSDGAGFLIRNHLKSVLPKTGVKQAYIPDIYGKERRKSKPSGEGKLGVEGMTKELLLKSLENCGAAFLGHEETARDSNPITKADFFELGLSGGSGSVAKRELLLRALDLPRHMSANAMLEVLNILYGKERFIELYDHVFDRDGGNDTEQ